MKWKKNSECGAETAIFTLEKTENGARNAKKIRKTPFLALKRKVFLKMELNESSIKLNRVQWSSIEGIKS